MNSALGTWEEADVYRWTHVRHFKDRSAAHVTLPPPFSAQVREDEHFLCEQIARRGYLDVGVDAWDSEPHWHLHWDERSSLPYGDWVEALTDEEAIARFEELHNEIENSRARRQLFEKMRDAGQHYYQTKKMRTEPRVVSRVEQLKRAMERLPKSADEEINDLRERWLRLVE
jgi:hypothetical protein